MVRVWHIATHTTNIGDGALVQGIQRTMQEDCSQKLEFIDDCLMHYSNYWGAKQYDSDFVHRINTECDLLLIGGGGMLDGSRSSTNSGMGFNLPLELFDQIKVPIVFYAVGHNTFNGQVYWNKSKLEALIKYVNNRKDAIFSVRNDGTRERLIELIGDIASGVHEIPDPGMYVHCDGADRKVVSSSKINIVIQLAGDNESARLSGLHWSFVPFLGKKVLSHRKTKALTRLGNALQIISVDRDVHFVLCPHLLRDLSITSEFYNLIPNNFSRLKFESSAILCGSRNASTFFDLYNQADLIIGMRGHSVICGVGLGTPTIALSSHNKVIGYMRSIGLEDRSVDINDSNSETKLIVLINRLLDTKNDEQVRLQKIRDDCRKQSQQFHRKIFKLITKN